MAWKGDPHAIHDDVDGEIDGLTEKATPVDADLIIIEDSADSNSKKKAQLVNLPGGGGTSDHGALTGLADDDHTQYLLADGTRQADLIDLAGLTGATDASRYVGATTSGAPASGTFAVGDFVITQDGNVYICTTAGSPGTWTQVGAAAATDSDAIHDNVAAEISAITEKGSPASGDWLLIEDAADSDNKKKVDWANLPAGGGGGAVFDEKPFIHTPPSTADTIDDEFNDATDMSGPTNGLDAKWTKQNLGTASWLVHDDDIAPGMLLFDIPASESADQAIHQSVPSGDFSVGARMAIHQTDRIIVGLFVVDSSGDGNGIFLDSGDNTIWLRDIDAWVNGGGATNTGIPMPATTTRQGVPAWLYLSWDDTAETVTCSMSRHDRVLVPPFTASRAFFGTTIAHVGVGRILGTVTGKFSVDSFRRLA